MTEARPVLVAALSANLIFAMLVLSGCGGSIRTASPRVTTKGVYHKVKAGQTLWSIARAYKIDVKTLTKANRLNKRDVLQVGQRLRIPGARHQQRVASRCPCGPSKKRSTTSSRTAKKKPSRAATNKPAAAPRAAASVPLIWPIRGPITRTFNRSGRQRHDGIDIAAPKGTPIRAAADGKVIFSDWGPGGYGRLVIVQHSADVVTVYAHNERNLVKSNQRVRKGQTIATVGRSGRATGYHLHFEVRRKTVPQPPFTFLPQRREASVPAPTWLREYAS